MSEPLAESTVTEWEVVCPGYVEGHPHPMPGHVVNGANGHGTTMPTSGRGHPRGRF